MLELVIPMTPPSGNHYVKHTRGGRHYVTPEAKRFKETVAVLSAGRSVEGNRFSVHLNVFYAKGQKGDADNLFKVTIDALQAAGVFNGGSDAAVRVLGLILGRDPENPRTVIRVEAI